jgi:16S rRNA (cytosine1402-N4)-methyltransferase
VTASFFHDPVMAGEVVDTFSTVPAGTLVDGTLGGAGHAQLLLESRPDCSLLGIDRDAEAVTAAREALAPFGDRVVIVHGGFEELSERLDGAAVKGEVVGVLLDLGVSSHQLDRPDRGFSYRADAPLDMRMDRSQARSAHDVVNEYEEQALSAVISRYGEERFARAIARRIVAHRPVTTTTELAEIVKAAIPAATRRTGPHPARRTFQAIRMEVNAELEHLEQGLDSAYANLAPGGRLAVLSYHSLEDRIVKRRFVDWTTAPPVPTRLPVRPEALPRAPARLVPRGAGRPTPDEIATNPRSESARLRVLERTAGPAPRGGRS